MDLINILINNIPHAVFWKNRKHTFMWCNQEFASQLGYASPDELIGKSDHDFSFTDAQIQKYHADEDEILHTGKSKLNYEELQRQPDGSIKAVLVSKVPYRDEHHQIIGILGIYTDISERKKQERQLKRAKKAAEAANIAKTQFIANMSHDIRTPLTGVIGMSDLLEKRELDPELRSFAHDVHECG